MHLQKIIVLGNGVQSKQAVENYGFSIEHRREKPNREEGEEASPKIFFTYALFSEKIQNAMDQAEHGFVLDGNYSRTNNI